MNDSARILKNLYQDDEKKRLRDLVIVLNHYRRYKAYNQLEFFEPNEAQIEFFQLMLQYNEILASWGNRVGKTKIAGIVIYLACRGEYPDWYTGKRFKGPVNVLIMGKTYKQIRLSSQRILINEFGAGFGTGVIPHDKIGKYRYVKDENDCIDYLKIPHVSGGESTIYFVTQKMDWANFMGSEFDIGWGDEQIDDTQYYSQFIRATSSTDQKLLILTATPEKGRTAIFDRFEKESRENCILHKASLWQATQYSREKQQEIHDSYPENERPYRVYGEPIFGTGLVYKVDTPRLKCKPFRIPGNFKRIAGIDFGRAQSKTAVVWIAIDPDPDTYCMYVYDAYWVKGVNPQQVVPFIQQRDRAAGFSIPIAYYRDGNFTEISTGNRVAHVYADLGLNMIEESAYLKCLDGRKSTSVSEGCAEIEFMMLSEKFKIFDIPQLNQIFDELRTYAIGPDGKIQKRLSNDPHHLDAARYAFVMERHAVAKPASHRRVPGGVIRMKKGIFHKN